MRQLPEKVLKEFNKGNFVVQGFTAEFNQVSADQSQEWLNPTGKKGGGVAGTTKTASALCRYQEHYALSYNLSSHFAAEAAI